MEWLDCCATWLQSILLQRWMSISHRRPLEHHEPRHCTDPYEQCQRKSSATGLLRANNAESHQHAVHERAQQSGAQKLPGHDGRWLWMPVNGRDDNFYIQVLSLQLKMLHCSYLKRHKANFLPKCPKSHKGTTRPMVVTCRQSSQGAVAGTDWPDTWTRSMKLHVYWQAGEFINTSENICTYRLSTVN